jgi:hypothetical protein
LSKPEEHTVLHFVKPYLYLNDAVMMRRKIEGARVKEEVRDWVRRQPGILTAYTNTEIQKGLPRTARFALQVERAFHPERSGDVVPILRSGWIFGSMDGRGTDHGQPHDNDALIPLLVWRSGIRPGNYSQSVSPLSITKTIATLYGFQAGAADAEVLKPVLGYSK